MKKVVFLGCENSHASMFLNYIKTIQKYSDVEVVGVYSHDLEASKKLAERFNVPILESYDQAVGIADCVVVTARHGDNHYKYAKPYIKKGVTLFLDKPITISEDEALALMKECKEKGVKVTGGSSLRFDSNVCELKQDFLENKDGNTVGGLVRCPVSLGNVNGGFFFYSQHLVEIVQEIFGRYPTAVQSIKAGKNLTVNFLYDDFVVTGLFVDEVYTCYYVSRFTDNVMKGKQFAIDGESKCFIDEWDEIYEIMSGKEQVANYNDFIAPVFVLNAIYRSTQSGQIEKVNQYEV